MSKASTCIDFCELWVIKLWNYGVGLYPFIQHVDTLIPTIINEIPIGATLISQLDHIHFHGDNPRLL